jgi:hypothetical protein
MTLTRRQAALVLFFAAALLPEAQAQESAPAPLITKAYEYAFPLFEHARLVYLYSHFAGNKQRVPVNRLGHRRQLVDHTARNATTPNNDTLYSSAAVDLSAGPVRLDVPDFGARYFSIAFLDAYTNNFAHLGTRTGQRHGGTYLIAGPDWRGEAPPGVSLIRAPGNHIVPLVRILIDGPQDLAEVHRLQDALTLTETAPSPTRPDLIQPKPGDPENFVAVVNQVMRDNPPPQNDAALLTELEQAGIGPGLVPNETQRDLWKTHFSAAQKALAVSAKTAGSDVAHWTYPPLNLGNFGTDYRTRAAAALRGIWANIPEEMHYAISGADRTGAAFDGDRSYRLHLPAGTPPADGFWSISMYEVTKTGLFFGGNPIHRYAIGDRTPGLTRNEDGSLDIFIQKQSPGAGKDANWLPIPAKHFMLVARAYLPHAALLDGSFHYPGVEPEN